MLGPAKQVAIAVRVGCVEITHGMDFRSFMITRGARGVQKGTLDPLDFAVICHIKWNFRPV